MNPAAPPTSVEAAFTSHDGISLRYRHWPTAVPAKRALLLFHRGHEHSARWQETVEALALGEVEVFAWDARGHGASPGDRGSAADIGVLIRDVEAFVRHVERSHGIAQQDMICIAHSVGAVIVAAWVHDFAPPLRGLVLATPAFRVRLYIPLAVPALRLRQRLFGHGYVKSYVSSVMLTHDPEQAEVYAADEAIFRQIAVNILLGLHDTGTRLIADAGAIRVPLLLLSAGSDWVVDNAAQRKFFDRLSSADKTLHHLPGFHHAIFHEKERHLVIEQIRAFVLRLFASPRVEPPSLSDADCAGYTKAEYDQLRHEPQTLSARLQRVVFGSVGKLSEGISLGHRAGFDSGETLDYVYENRPRGLTPLGRVMDRAYLESPGWTGIRLRRLHLEEMLRDAIRELHAARQIVRIFDAACGGGRYVLETLAELREIPASAVLRDYKHQNLDVAERLRRRLGLAQVKIMHGDAFDPASYTTIQPRPNIGIVSGLLELFPGNDAARVCLGGFARAIAPGGLLIYTNQPWHPQLRFIAGVLRNREGEPWIMRRRTQEEMDELVREAGFVKEAQAVDQWGIFTVSRARRAGG
ncbi:MAG: hypothetical protein QOE70_3323 [Chthoniobacter sp.]|jgi:alpha-beta hydrolase superfamily lysophospholipase|nr:hypothetical protein [Chthoniobacter sp.]